MNNQTGKLVAGIYLALNFDPDILVYKDYTFGKRPMLFVDCVDPGSFKIAALDFSGFNQNQPLISVQFMSLNTGISSLTSSIEIYNAFGKMLGTASDTESIDVREAAHPVPEPSAMLLLGGGLSSIGLLRMRRKNRQV
ncbi:MAG: PEP-CTERM sorting domain-containing protein [Desulfuromonadaceae bacterium]